MSYIIPLPEQPSGAPRDLLDIIDGRSTAVQRALRRGGLAEREPSTSAALLATFDSADPGFVFFDVGANIGLYSWLCAALFEPAAVVAFEPSPDTAGTARNIVERNGLAVHVEQVAVGAQPGTATLHLSAVSDASNSLAEGFKPSIGTVEVPVTTIDSYAQESGLVPSVIKIDVESLEPEVLKGAHSTLEAHRPVLVVEILHRQGLDHGPLVAAAMEGFGYFGYQLGQDPTWEPADNWSGSHGDGHRDWLLLPKPVDPAFIERFELWRQRLSACTADRNHTPTTSLATPASQRERSLVRRVYQVLPESIQRRVRASRR